MKTKELDKLVNYWLSTAKKYPSCAEEYRQAAYGAVIYHTIIFPEDEKAIMVWWDTCMKPQFDKIIFNCYC